MTFMYMYPLHMYAYPFMEMLSFMVIILFTSVTSIMNNFITSAPPPKLILHDSIFIDAVCYYGNSIIW